MRTRAAVFHGPGRALEVREIELEELRDDEVLVRMVAVGICGTDLHNIKGEWQRPTPMVLGHEGAGIVEEVGNTVSSVRPPRATPAGSRPGPSARRRSST